MRDTVKILPGLALGAAAIWALYATFGRVESGPEAGGEPAEEAESSESAGDGEEKMSMAFEALQYWAESRSYPAKEFPEAGFYRAHRLAVELARRSDVDLPSQDDWVSIGPSNRGGRTNALAVDPRNPNVVYAGSASGGLWRMTLSGSNYTWRYLDTRFPVLGVNAIAIDPRNSRVLYIGTGEVYGYGSSIGGLYQRTTRGSYGIGLLKSTDSGATWSKSLDWSASQRRGVQVVKLHPSNPDIVFAGTSEGVYRSKDAGATWEQVSTVVMVTDLVFSPSNPDIIFIACGNLGSPQPGIYRSTNGGNPGSFQKLAGGLPASYGGKAMLAVSPAAPNNVWADIANQSGSVGLFRSQNNGDTWTNVNGSTNWAGIQGWYSHFVRVHPQDANRVVVGGVSFYGSTNGGATLQTRSGMHADHHTYADHPTNPNIVYFGNDGGVYQSTDGGSTFRMMNNGYVTSQFYAGFASSPKDPNHAIGGLQDNQSMMFSGTATWRTVLGGDGAYCAINPVDDNIVYGSIYFLDIRRSRDRGRTWSAIADGLAGSACFVSPFVLAPSQPNTVYGGKTYLYKSTNQGDTWQSMNGGQTLNGNPILSIAVSPEDPNVVYAATVPGGSRRAQVFASTNGGQTMTNVTGTLPDRFYEDMAVSPRNRNMVYVTLSGYGSSHLYRSDNGGQSWIDIGKGLPDVPAHAVILDPANPNIVYVGNDLGVFVSLDNGLSWMEWRQGLPTALMVYDLSLSISNRRIRAVTHGNGVYERAMLPPDATPVVRRAAGRGLTLSRRPEGVAFTLPTAADVVLEILDAQGRTVRRLASGRHAAGAHLIPWDGADAAGRRLGAGGYLLRLKAGTETRVLRLDGGG